MDPWFVEHLVCPRDHRKLTLVDGRLLCPDGHEYPVVDDIPVMLLEEVEPTQCTIPETLQKVATGEFQQASADGKADSTEAIDPHVQKVVAATCGYLYVPLLGKLKRYPIPELRLPQASGELFLDIGCNWGRWCVAAARKGYSPVGIDPAIDAIAAARKVSRDLGVSARYVVADARYLPFPPAFFDVAFSYSVLQHFSKDDARQSLAEVARVLKPGGTSFIQMPNVFGIRCIYHQARRRFRATQGFDVRYWTPSELRNTFSRLIGETSVSVDGYFGLGIQANDMDLLPRRFRAIVRTSEALRKFSERAPWMANAADSLYLTSSKLKDQPEP